jgi:YD repeat-containing protein
MNISGTYNNNFSAAADIYTNFTYDKANRLLSSKYASGYYYTDDSLTNTYDRDGNILTLHRKSNSDNFNYQYVTNTNKLKRVSGSSDQFSYDYNGNLISDELNKNYDAVYDYRNLLIYLRSEKSDETSETPATITHLSRYYYDEAGNRTRKVTYKESKDNTEGEPDWETHADNNDWILVTDEYYVRDASGKEIANYVSNSITFWNIYGKDNVGRINADTTKQFYLKDHLGSTRAVINSANQIISSYEIQISC